ncbi:b90 [Murid betaherpesvirus 8]|uniref:B90 n=2 Tax=Rat cytomegalovirus (isolate England) TaxID=1261657 RepID=K7YA60_RCMVE|nr:e90 [Murid betaherpesvirus 8]AKE44259.1 a90 [Rat cytomegalovirus ALL-03]AFX83404.1 e90 [Murid betaherpesvirus 8]AKB93284.1 b90 [Murid betaherpesvirus 8]WEG71877.1 envelope protein m90 [Murid betaherpesvirus 8]WPH24999.1 b90 [Murid betaherpesvirus 8]
MTFIFDLLLVCLAATHYTSASFYPNQTREDPQNTTSTTSNVYVLNVTIIASNSTKSGVINETTFVYLTHYGDNGENFGLAAMEVHETFKPVLEIWFKNNSGYRFNVVHFGMWCNETYTYIRMNSPPRVHAFSISLKNMSEPLMVHILSSRLCIRKVEEIITKKIPGAIKYLLTTVCRAFIRKGITREKILTVKSDKNTTVVINMLVILLLCIALTISICIYALMHTRIATTRSISRKSDPICTQSMIDTHHPNNAKTSSTCVCTCDAE